MNLLKSIKFEIFLRIQFKSPKATNIIACGETVGNSPRKRPDAESVEQIVIIVARRQRAINKKIETISSDFSSEHNQA